KSCDFLNCFWDCLVKKQNFLAFRGSQSTAPEVMPVDLTVLFNTSKFLSLRHPSDYGRINGDDDDDDDDDGQNRKRNRRRKNGEISDDDSSSPTSTFYQPSNHVCRRAASFPTLNLKNKRHSLLMTSDSMSQKCFSESEIRDENKIILNGLTLDDLKRQFAALIIVQDKKIVDDCSLDDDRILSNHDRPRFENNNDYDDDVDIHRDDSNRHDGGAGNGEILHHKKSAAKKKVSFADDTGHLLAVTRVMAEPSDVPPVLTSPTALAVIAAYDPDSDSMHNPFLPGTALLSSTAANFCNGGAEGQISSSTTPRRHWRLDFKQPASDYMRFRVKLEAKNVALENVLVDNVKESLNFPFSNHIKCRESNLDDGSSLNGTIKVKNLSFEKFVFVRYTTDQWKTFRDESAQYVKPSSKHTSRPDLIDTFRFDFPIPEDDILHPNLEFCVCFRLSNREFWDNNNENGGNFKISSAKFSPSKLDGRRSHSDSKLLSRIDSASGDESSDSETSSTSFKKKDDGGGADDDDGMFDMDGEKSLRVKRRMRRRRSSNDDAFELQMDNWSEFSTWKHLDGPGPYW
uniref:CBM21 domain-containing protein n=1 Tax=Romanomermis culicivorax TaxID=13658 RepID=A0A915JP72_ROMCU